MSKVSRALISVSDKRDVDWLAGELSALGVDIISTGGTYKLLSQSGVSVTPVAELTGFPEMLDGRVKTLHPKVHGGILADRSKGEHLRQLDFQKIPLIDLVVVNLYPFAKTIAKPGVTREEAIEQIDIGGPTMVRAAAKNHAHVAVVVNPDRYRSLIEEMKKSGGVISDETRRELAEEAFAHTAEYDATISAYLSGGERTTGSREVLEISLDKVSDLRYGENPHQAAALYAEKEAGPESLARAEQIGGGALSFNNILDGEAAWWTVLEFEKPAAVIIKHNNPCGVAEGEDQAESYLKALECDPVSAFGSVIAFNRPLTAPAAEALKDNFVELLIAPGFDPDALRILGQKEDMRILEMEKTEGEPKGLDYRRIHGGLLVQDYDLDSYDRSTMKVVSEAMPEEDQWEDLLFAWKVCKQVKSNAIIFARGGATVGVGAGQMSRVDAVMIASEKAGGRSEGAAMASDAFFPFPDGIERAADAGIAAVIQPGGSVRDDEVIAACNENGMAMVFTGKRHFRH